jgi:hypothetical protein
MNMKKTTTQHQFSHKAQIWRACSPEALAKGGEF